MKDPRRTATARLHRAMMRKPAIDVPGMIEAICAGANVNAPGEGGRTALMLAACRDLPSVVPILLNHAARPEQTDRIGKTALTFAAWHGSTVVTDLLLAAGANPHHRDAAGMTPMLYAAWNGHHPVLRRLLEHGADPEAIDPDGWSPLTYAAAYGHPTTARVLLDRAVIVDRPNHAGTTPLMLAVLHGHAGPVRALLAHGADVRRRGADGTSLLQLLARGETNPDLVAPLLDAGADPTATAMDGGGTILEDFASHPDLLAALDAALATPRHAAVRTRVLQGLSPQRAARDLPRASAAQAATRLSWRRRSTS